MNLFDFNSILTVSQLTDGIKKMLETEYRFVKVSGEISNLKTPFSGHSYFTLKDDKAQIRAVLFKQQKKFVDIALEDGQQVAVFGRIAVYEPRGEYQLVADSVVLHGLGLLLQKFEQLKQQLAGKGYFSEELKKSIPAFPMKIAVITSPTGAALQDFLKITKLRKSPQHIVILPVAVQGKTAHMEIVNAINTANMLHDVEVIVLCRGGGSLEDLWAFNEEKVAEAIYQSKLPIVTGIGHQIDTSIADLCADYRCSTPTAAAEKLILQADKLQLSLIALRKRMQQDMKKQLHQNHHRLENARKMIGTSQNFLDKQQIKIDLRHSHLLQAMHGILQSKEYQLQSIEQQMLRENPKNRVAMQSVHIHGLFTQLVFYIHRILDKKDADLAKVAALLSGVSPLATLSRGYAIARKKIDENGQWSVITRADNVKAGEEINVLLDKGELYCNVTKSLP